MQWPKPEDLRPEIVEQAHTDIGFARQMIGEMVDEIKAVRERYPDQEIGTIAMVASRLWALDQRRICQFLAVALVAQADREAQGL